MNTSGTNPTASERSTPPESQKSMLQHNSKYKNAQHNTGLQLNCYRTKPKTSYNQTHNIRTHTHTGNYRQSLLTRAHNQQTLHNHSQHKKVNSSHMVFAKEVGWLDICKVDKHQKLWCGFLHCHEHSNAAHAVEHILKVKLQ